MTIPFGPRAAVLAALLVCLAVAPVAAHGSSPGTNGRLAFTAATGDDPAAVETMAPDGSDRVRLTPGFDQGPAWAPEGSRLAFASGRDGVFADLFTMTAAGGAIRAVRHTDGPELDPTWSPDGSQLAFSLDDRVVDPFTSGPSGGTIGLVDLDGDEYRLLSTTAGGAATPAWSPDGTLIAYSRFTSDPASRDPYERGLAVVSPDGSRDLLLTGAPGTKDADPDWAPDGQSIAFVRSTATLAGTTSDLYVLGEDGSLSLRVRGVRDRDRLSSPVWSPDGRQIAFLRGELRGTSEQVAVVDADGSNERVITADPTHKEGLSWQPVHPASDPAPRSTLSADERATDLFLPLVRVLGTRVVVSDRRLTVRVRYRLRERAATVVTVRRRGRVVLRLRRRGRRGVNVARGNRRIGDPRRWRGRYRVGVRARTPGGASAVADG